MSDSFWGYLIGYIFGAYGSKEKLMDLGKAAEDRENIRIDKKYVPKFSGRWINTGSTYEEDWEYVTPLFRSRYVNVIEKEENYVISINWEKKHNAIDLKECEDQRDAETEVKCFSIEYDDKPIIYEHAKASYFIYTIETNELIKLRLMDSEDLDLKRKRRYSNDKNIRVLDALGCLDMEEATTLLREMKSYYEVYKKVEINNMVHMFDANTKQSEYPKVVKLTRND